MIFAGADVLIGVVALAAGFAAATVVSAAGGAGVTVAGAGSTGVEGVDAVVAGGLDAVGAGAEVVAGEVAVVAAELAGAVDGGEEAAVDVAGGGGVVAGVEVAEPGAGVAGFFCAAFLSGAFKSPQMSFAVIFCSGLVAVDAGGSTGFAGAVSAGLTGAAASAADLACRSFNFFCRSAISESFIEIKRWSFELMSSSCLTRDLSSLASCSRAVSDSFVRASSALTSALSLPVPAAVPARSADAAFLPALGGTSARRSDLAGFASSLVAYGAGSVLLEEPVRATSVGATGALPLQLSCWLWTCSIASRIDPLARISSALGMRKIAPRRRALMLS